MLGNPFLKDKDDMTILAEDNDDITILAEKF